jgi:predicted dehydrogenase
MSRKVRLGVVGTGAIGRAHLKGCQECKGMEVTAVCDVDAGRARAAAAAFGVRHAFARYRDLLAAEVVDAVSVCTPNNTHMPIALAAFAAGKHVLCEKPLAMNAQQARRMVEAAKKAGRVLMSAQCARYGAEAQFLKKLAEGGRFGEIYYAKVVWLRRAGIPRGWFQDKRQSGGGPLIDLGVHAVDLLWWIMGRPKPVSAYGVIFEKLGQRGQGMGDWGVGYNPSKFTVEDQVAGTIRFEDGRALGLDISWAAHTADCYWLRLFGTKGGAQLAPELVIYEMDGKTKVDVRPQPPQRDQYAAEIQHFVDCLQRGEEPMSPGWQSVVVMEMLDAIYKSARTGRLVSL